MTGRAEARKKIKQDDIPLPLYYRVAERLREQILWGEWPPHHKLPTEAGLAEEYGVSRPTIRKAKDLLIREGLVRSIQGSGCYVNDPEHWTSAPPTVDDLDDVFRIGQGMAFKIHEFGLQVNNDAIKAKLNNDQDLYVFLITGVRYQHGEPISHVTYYLPRRLGAQISLESLDEGPFIPQFERLTGVRAVEGVKTISLGQVGERISRHLGLRPEAMVLVEETVYVDSTGKPIEYLITRYRDRLPYSIRVRRNSGAAGSKGDDPWTG